MKLKKSLSLLTDFLPLNTVRKKYPYSELFCPHFPAFRLNMERYGISLRIQSECGKIRTRITPDMDTFHVEIACPVKFSNLL